MASRDRPVAPVRLKALEKATGVFDYLARSGPSNLSELARGLDAPTSSVHRTLSSLVGEGWLSLLPDKRYALSASMWETGVRSLEYVHPNLLELASLAVQSAAAEIGEATSLGVPCGVDTLFVARVSAPNPNPFYTPVAIRQPAYTSASGKVMLAFAEEATFDAVCAGGLRAFTKNTVTSRRALRAELLEAKRDAVALNRGEMNVGRRGLAVPVLTADERPAAALGSSLPVERFSEEFVRNATAVLHEHAAHLSMALGYRGPAFREDRFA